VKLSGYETLKLIDQDAMCTHLIEADPLHVEVLLPEAVHQCIRLDVVVILPNEVVVHHLGEASEEGMVLDRKVILQEAALDVANELVLPAPGTVVAEACLEEVDPELTILLDPMAEVHRQAQESMKLVVCHRLVRSALRRQ